jgi:pyroglutamyl-peptidase
VTGFGPFPEVDHNASASLVKDALANAAFPGAVVRAAVLPVLWSDALEEAASLSGEFQPHAIIHFGVAKRCAGFEIERRAVNLCGPKADLGGKFKAGLPVVPMAPPVLHSTLDPSALCQALHRHGLQAALSGNAGRYLCNAVLYASLLRSNAQAVFVHIPAYGVPDVLVPRLSYPEAVVGARILIREAIRILGQNIVHRQRPDEVGGIQNPPLRRYARPSLNR